MLDLIKYIVNQFAENKEEVEYIVQENTTSIDITVVLSESDMGKVIGKQGKIAKAMRTLVRAATPRGAKKYNVEIKEKGTVNSDGTTNSDKEENADQSVNA